MTYITSTLVGVKCCSCGIPFGLPDNYYTDRLDDHAGWYCPNGHRQHFTGKTEAEKLREELEREQRQVIRLRNAKENVEAQRDAAQRSAAAQKGQATRLRRRAAAGVCACCKRSFQDMAAHMATKHPDFVKAVKP